MYIYPNWKIYDSQTFWSCPTVSKWLRVVEEFRFFNIRCITLTTISGVSVTKVAMVTKCNFSCHGNRV